MVKHTQTICRVLPTNCLSVFEHFVALALKELMLLRGVFRIQSIIYDSQRLLTIFVKNFRRRCWTGFLNMPLILIVNSEPSFCLFDNLFTETIFERVIK